jgi:proline iminopeptidase
MASEPMIFGLAERHYNELVQLFKRHPGIEQVLIFGSRAKGTSKPYSDIDLAVIAPTMDDQGFSRLWQGLMICPWCSRSTCYTGTGWISSP